MKLLGSSAIVAISIAIIFASCSSETEIKESPEETNLETENSDAMNKVTIHLDNDNNSSYKESIVIPKKLYGNGDWHLRRTRVRLYKDGTLTFQGKIQSSHAMVVARDVTYWFYDSNHKPLQKVDFGKISHYQKPGTVGQEMPFCCLIKDTSFNSLWNDVTYLETYPKTKWSKSKGYLGNYAGNGGGACADF